MNKCSVCSWIALYDPKARLCEAEWEGLTASIVWGNVRGAQKTAEDEHTSRTHDKSEIRCRRRGRARLQEPECRQKGSQRRGMRRGNGRSKCQQSMGQHTRSEKNSR